MVIGWHPINCLAATHRESLHVPYSFDQVIHYEIYVNYYDFIIIYGLVRLCYYY